MNVYWSNAPAAPNEPSFRLDLTPDQTWLLLPGAKAACRIYAQPHGIGFVLTKSDPDVERV